ncbi:Ig-like domain-containing protein [Mycolicibacterium arenosum]|uniref:Ig-like domain-containing protein n=1 Tax=Mycolicibacterium arenosum TaxID=2952157 RepID=A0ABT1LVC0_9MYCO|nr:Ig-like domain-containing protein [Mycolicibacterium sp. CAU 1645]MCP9270848.1 Ig-like domain-containing protein [Mycolicibacterium sp. CAU 1645]
MDARAGTHAPRSGGAARYIGRIGALAVALGVGAAVAAGQGAGVARADDGSDSSASGASSESSSADSPTAASDPDPTATATGTSDSAPTGGTSSAPSVPEMNVSSSGGAHTSGSGSTTAEPEPAPAPAPESQLEPEPESAEPPARRNDSPPTPQQTATPRPATADAPVATVPDTEPAQPHSLEPVAQQIDSTTPMFAEPVEAADVAAPEPAPPSVVATMLAAAVAPFVLPGPGAPAASPLLWAVLAWTRRESDQTSSNTPPVADIQNVVMDENTSHSGTLPPATDADGDPVTYTLQSPPTNGTVVVDPGGEYTYTPAAGYFGRDSFVFSVTDPLGGRADYTVFVTVTMVNNAPVAADASVTVSENGSRTGSLPSATDADGEEVTYSLAAGPSRGTVTVDPDGSFTYTPDPGVSGADAFRYDVTDGFSTSTYTVTVTIEPINHAPVAVDAIVTTHHGVPVSFAGAFNDPDGDPLTFTLDRTTSSGSFSVAPDGTVTFTPRSGFVGEDTVGYTVTDPSGLTASATITVVVTNGPIVTRDDVYIGDDSVYSGNVLANDVDSDRDPITVVDYTKPSRGTLVMATDGTFSYTPEPGVSGTFEFTYTVSDGASTGTASVRLIVAAIGKPPLSAPDSATVEAGETVVIDVLANDTDPNDEGLYIVSVDVSQGVINVTESGIEYTADPDFTGIDTFTYTVSNGWSERTETVTVTVLPSTAPVTADDRVIVRAGEKVVIDALGNDRIPKGASVVVTSQPYDGTVRFDEKTGTFVYTPNEESRRDGFEYTVTDTLGRTSSAWVTITVDQEPYANDDYASTPRGDAVDIDVLKNDYDSEDGPLTVRVVSQPEYGGVATAQKDGTIRFTPTEGFEGYVEFSYSITDGAGNTATATVAVSVYDPTPVELDKKYTVGRNKTITMSAALGLLSNTQYAEFGKARLYVKPRNGTVTINLDGSFTYTPNQGFVGEDSFQFALDGGQFGDSATAFISVTPDGPGTDASYGIAVAASSAIGACWDTWMPWQRGAGSANLGCLYPEARREEL